ncbi:hypothetical protein [Pseudomonas neuropathica]|uniref:hypothetical protein n=1 Tax=Pseudomonas neuropathica TaxID=2730425 RepID=UPI003EBE4D47
MSSKKTEIKFKSGRSKKTIHGTMKAEVDGTAKEFAAFYFIEESNGISAAFGKREEDYVSVSNVGGYLLVSYNVGGASIPWDTDGRMLDIKKDSVSGRYFGNFTAQFSASVPPDIPKAVSGIFEVWED